MLPARWIATAATAAILLIAAHALFHRDVGGWIAKGATQDTVALEGHLVEWEWLHVGATTRLLDPRPRGFIPTSTQDAFRFVPGLLVAALRGPAGGFYGAALAATIAAWLAAAAALAAVATAAAGSAQTTGTMRARLALVAGAVLAAQGTGYIAFLGNVDAHQFGYAAVALWCGAWLVFAPDRPAQSVAGTARSAAVGLALCIAGYTMEVAYPLLLSSWLALAGAAIARDIPARTATARALALTAAFAVPYLAFQLLMRASLGHNLVPLNDPLQQLNAQIAAARDHGPTGWAAMRLAQVAERWLAAFPVPVSVLAILGLFVVPPRWLWWSLAVLLPLFGAVFVTKLIVRTLFLVHPPIYVLAAAGTAWLSVRVGALAPRVRWLPAAVLAALLLAVSLATNADLWGDYYLPTWWWGIQ